MDERVELVGTGFVQQVREGGVDRIPPFDPRTGEHYWVFPITYHIADPRKFYGDQSDGPPLLDLETLVQASCIGCWHCEQPWSERLASRRCKGRP